MADQSHSVASAPIEPQIHETRQSTAHPPESNTSPTKCRQDKRRSLTPANLNPHDIVLSQVFEQARNLEEADHVDTSDRQNTLEPGSSDSPNPKQYSILENLYDPSTGAVLGVFAPVEHEDNMWTQLAKIRDLQSEIATMHLQMESVAGGSERPLRSKRQDSEDDEGGDPKSTAEQQTKMAKDAEFARLEEKFAHKKQAIDALMDKASSRFGLCCYGTLTDLLTPCHSISCLHCHKA